MVPGLSPSSGTAKSELCRRLSSAAQLRLFERTLTRFTTPEALFGPLGTLWNSLGRSPSMHALTTAPLDPTTTPQELFGPLSLAALERDEYRRATAGYAPAAELLFLDEV